MQVVLATYNNGSPGPEFNNAAQAWNHQFYWESMGPNGGGELSASSECINCTSRKRLAKPSNWAVFLASAIACTVRVHRTGRMIMHLVAGEPSGDLKAAIDSAFGSYENFKKEFSTAGATQFGSGWAWLVKDGGALKVTKTPNAENPLHQGQVQASTVISLITLLQATSCYSLHGMAAGRPLSASAMLITRHCLQNCQSCHQRQAQAAISACQMICESHSHAYCNSCLIGLWSAPASIAIHCC